MLERRIEEAALNSWPALRQVLFDGWVMRCDRGYTKRANSVTPVYTSLLPLQEKIVTCERFYMQQQLPMIFRLPSFLSTMQEFDAILAQREYQNVDLSLVLCTELASGSKTYDPALHRVSLATWLALFCQFNRTSVEQHQPHREILERIVSEPLFAVLYKNELPVACGIGVLENDVFGLFDIVTDPQQRKKGYGTQLVTSMLDWARQNGAYYAYLQVVSTNQVARRVYTNLGFHELYQYWYRVRSMSFR